MKEVFKAACRGCHGGCIHLVTVEDGKLVDVRPDPEGPLNQGHGCGKGMTIIEQTYHPDRLMYPMKRIGERGSGQWERISWDEAYDAIAEKLNGLIKDYGPQCFASVSGTGRHCAIYLTRFTNMLGSPNRCSSGSLICLGPRHNAGLFTAGIFAGVDYYGETKPKGMIVWGSNPEFSGPDGELQWHFKDAIKRETEMVVIDPYPIEAAKRAKYWLRVRPGTDGALALGILNVIIQEDLYDHEFVDNWTIGFEELKERCKEYDLDKVSAITTVPKEDILGAARWMAQTKPLSMEWGNAFEQGINANQTSRAILMIPALTGNWDVPGGFVESMEVAPNIDTLRKNVSLMAASNVLKKAPLTKFNAPFAHPFEVIDAMRTGKPYQVRALFSTANNTLLSIPDTMNTYEALKKLDLFVYMDFFMTPTAEMADYVLPAGLWPEVDGVYCMPEFAEMSALCMQKVVSTGECKSDEEIFFELSKRMGYDYGDGSETQEGLLDKILETLGERRPEYKGIKFKDFKKMGHITPERTYYNYKKRGGFNTPSGKFELYSKQMAAEGADPLPCWEEQPESVNGSPELAKEYPLTLGAGRRRQQYFISNNRQIRSLRKAYPFPLVSMNPATAKKYGIEDGDWVWIETPRGKITQKCEYVPEMAEDSLVCDFGWWYPEDESPLHGVFESNANVLTTSKPPYGPYGEYTMRGLLCKISKNPSKAIEERYYNSKYACHLPVDDSSDCIVLDPDKCLLCRNCIETCANTQTVGALEMKTIDGLTRIVPVGAEKMGDSKLCVGCGQCAASCPTGAIRMKSSVEKLKEAIADKDTLVVAQVAPSVRVGISEAFGLPKGSNSMGRVTAALKKLGVDAVHDTLFSADLTIMEEGKEFLERLEGKGELPLFTSCCPAWVKFCEQEFPELAGHISTTRSPQQMLAAVMRDHYKKAFLISIMPCTAKKAELKRKESATDGRQDMDLSLTTQEIVDLLKEEGIDFAALPEENAENPYSEGSGGGAIFGITGGVTEAVIRTLVPELNDETLKAIAESGVRGEGGRREFTLNYQGKDLKIAVVSGLGYARALMERVKAGEHFDLIEVMACPGGCVMGGGQPHNVYDKKSERRERTAGLFSTDEKSAIRSSACNTQVRDTLAGMDSEKKHKLLHRNLH